MSSRSSNEESTPSNSCDESNGEQFYLSPEIPKHVSSLLPKSSLSRKRLDFELVNNFLDSESDEKISEKAKKRKTSAKKENQKQTEPGPSSLSFKLSALARGHYVRDFDKTKMPPKSLPSSSNSSGSTSKSSRSVSATTPGQRNELTAHHSSLQATSKTKGRRVSISPSTESSESTLKSSSTFRTTPKSAGPKNKLTTPRNVSLRPTTSLTDPGQRKSKASVYKSKEAHKSASLCELTTPESSPPPSSSLTNPEISTVVTADGSRKRPANETIYHHSPSGETPPTKKIEFQLTKILHEVQKANSRLDSYDDKLDSLQDRLQKLEEKPSSSVSSSDASVSKRKVPPEVRHLVRDVYKTLLDDVEANFDGFDLKKRYTDSVNQAVVKKVLSETRMLDPAMCAVNITDAIRRFFQSKLEEKSLKDKGTYDIKVQRQRRKNRLVKKLNDRRAVLEKVSDERKAKYREVIIISFMSSEESGEERDENQELKPVLYVNSLPWRSPTVNQLFSLLDNKIERGKSKRARSQMYSRVMGKVSDRLKPTDLPDDFWGFA